MKRIFIVCLSVILLMTSCTAEKDLYGVWYVENQGQRDVFQFSESSDGKDAFIWAVYDVVNDEIVSISKGYFNIDGKTMRLTYIDGNTLVLSFDLDGEQLVLKSDTASMVLSKYE